MSEQRVRGKFRPELRVGSLPRRAEPIHLPAPEPGKHLRAAVDTVLAELGASPSPQALHHCDDTLRMALAWTAAADDTCRIAAAVHAVRDARCMLDAEEPDEARVALLSARDGLRPPS